MAYYAPEDTMRVAPLEALSSATLGRIATIKEFGQDFYDFCDELPPSADMTLAKRKIEEAVMWAVKAITA